MRTGSGSASAVASMPRASSIVAGVTILMPGKCPPSPALSRSSSAVRVDETLELVTGLPGTRLGKSDRLGDLGSHGSLNPLKTLVIQQFFVLQATRESHYGITLLPLLDLLLLSIQLGIEHGVSAKTIGTELEEERPMPGPNHRHRLLRRCLDRQDIHAVHRLSTYVVAGRLARHVGHRFR